MILSNQVNINKSTMRPFDLDETPLENSPDPPTRAATAVDEESFKNRFGCQVTDLEKFQMGQIAEISRVQDLA